MATPPIYDITFYAGDTERFSMSLKNSDGTVVEGLSSAIATMDIKIDFKAAPILRKAGVIDEVTGSITFDFSQEDTNLLMGEDNFSKKSYRYDVQVDDTDTLTSKTVIRGTLVILEDVTRP